MFSLSRCKVIIQGVKYSTFSILASLLGNNKLINYSSICESHDTCLIHTWNSVVEINGEKSLDKENLQKVCKFIDNIIVVTNEKSI